MQKSKCLALLALMIKKFQFYFRLFSNSILPRRHGEASDADTMHQGALLRPTQVPGHDQPIPRPL